MKCPEPRCDEVLDPNDTCETDLWRDARKKLKYHDVCGKCFKKIAKRGAAVQGGEGRQGSTEGQTSEAAAIQMELQEVT